ncbi:MAG TPA: tetratricopeptide repeat protein [Isosphaeraceae bacterium]|jgi:class 3 adenylate cyclase/tetratricopeptide (TPR) repeat protein|nr:tetratricopeptide repeat protein [Isosphaeraceae bacterium]
MPSTLITMVFTDLVNSTAVKSQLAGGDITARNQAYLDTILTPHREHVESLLDTHRGRVVKTEGDAYFLVFDDAAQAAKWALAAQQKHRDHPIATPLGPLQVKIGMHTGSPLADPKDAGDFIGREVDYAARVAALASGGQIVASEATAALVRAADIAGLALHAHGERELKGIGCVPIFELVEAGAQPHELKESVLSPSNLPAPPEGFTGRAELLAELRERISAGGVMILKGEGGIGKTALSLRAAYEAHMAGELPGGVAWLNCALQPTRDECLHQAAQVFFGDRLEREHIDRCHGRVMEHLQHCVALMVLDNFETVVGDAPILRWLAQVRPPARVLVTTREAPVGLFGRVVPVRELSRAEAARLFVHQATAGGLLLEGQDEIVDQLCEAVGDQPLAIRLLAARAPRLPLPRLLERVRRDLEVLKTQDPCVPSHHQSARACFTLSFGHLSDAARDLLLRLSVFPDGAGMAVISAVLGSQDWDDAAEELVAMSVWRLAGERYTIHPLVRQFALEQLGDQRAEAERRAGLAVSHFLRAKSAQSGFGGAAPAALKKALDWCEAERRNLLACAAFALQAGEWDAVYQLSSMVFNFWQVRGYWADAQWLYQQALEATRRGADRSGEAHTLNRLGLILTHQERWNEAASAHEQALSLWRALADRKGEGNTLKHLARIHQLQGRLDESEVVCQQALALLREVGDRMGEAKTLAYLGNIYRMRQQWSGAEQAYQQSLQLSRAIGDRYDEGDALIYLGDIYHRMGRSAEAESAYQQSLTIWHEFHDIQHEAIALDELGVIYRDQGRWDEAETAHLRSAQIFREVANRRREGIALGNLARLLAAKGDVTRALEPAHRAVSLLECSEDAPALQAARDFVAELSPSRAAGSAGTMNSSSS